MQSSELNVAIQAFHSDMQNLHHAQCSAPSATDCSCPLLYTQLPTRRCAVLLCTPHAIVKFPAPLLECTWVQHPSGKRMVRSTSSGINLQSKRETTQNPRYGKWTRLSVLIRVLRCGSLPVTHWWMFKSVQKATFSQPKPMMDAWSLIKKRLNLHLEFSWSCKQTW